jgi:hypothetical protein
LLRAAFVRLQETQFVPFASDLSVWVFFSAFTDFALSLQQSILSLAFTILAFMASQCAFSAAVHSPETFAPFIAGHACTSVVLFEEALATDFLSLVNITFVAVASVALEATFDFSMQQDFVAAAFASQAFAQSSLSCAHVSDNVSINAAMRRNNILVFIEFSLWIMRGYFGD